jgi:hypothetical protein
MMCPDNRECRRRMEAVGQQCVLRRALLEISLWTIDKEAVL